MATNAQLVEQAYAAFGRGKPAGYGAVHVFRVRDDKITGFHEYVDADATIA
jgi:ketosteroid isomerase-like protein